MGAKSKKDKECGINELFHKLIQQNYGCNLTLFNQNMLKEALNEVVQQNFASVGG